MPLFSTSKKGKPSFNFAMHEGLNGFSKGIPINITLYDNNLEISKRKPYSPDTVVLNYSQIADIALTSETEIEYINKNSIGRALVGGAIFGGAGALIGGVSGIGQKQKKNVYNLIAIAYTPTGSNYIKTISFQIVGATLKFKEFINQVRQKANLPENKTEDGKTIL